MNPSSRPIRSSWSRWPLLEKNLLPGSRQKLCRRPLPVDQPHPLARAQRPAVHAGPRLERGVARACGLAAGPAERDGVGGALVRTLPERPVHVGGRQHAVDASRRPRAGGTPSPARRLIARTRSSPVIVGRQREPVARSPRATVETATQGRRSSGVASSAASLTTPTGRPLPVTVTMLPACGLRARRTASASGRSSGTARVRRARSRATRCGSRAADPGRRHRRGGAGPQEAGDRRRPARSRQRPARCRARAPAAAARPAPRPRRPGRPSRRRRCRGACCR